MWKRAKLITAGVLAVLALVLVLQNTERVETSVLFWVVPMPRALLLLVTAAIGFIAGVLVSLQVTRNKD